MLKNTLLLSYLIILGTILTSCAIHSGNMSGNVTDPNCKITGLALGTSKTTLILWMGGLKKDALVHRAKQRCIITIN